MGNICGLDGEDKKEPENFGGKPFARPRRRSEDNFRMDPRETGSEDGRWTEQIWDCVQ